MEDKHKGPWYLNPFVDFLFLLLIVIATPIIVNNGLETWALHSAPSLNNANWLGFWGSYAGSALGVLATLVAFSFTYYQNNKQSKDIKAQNKIIQEQNQAIQEQNRLAEEREWEQARLQALPFINLSLARDASSIDLKFYLDFDGWAITSNPDCIPIAFIFENIGAGPAVEVSVSSADLGHFSPGGSKRISIGLPVSDKVDILRFKIKFFDREDRAYVEHVILHNNGSGYKISKVTPPKLLIGI